MVQLVIFIQNMKLNLKGIGRIIYLNGDKYEGEFKNDMAEGYGFEYFSNGNKYIGEFINRVREGFGIFY